MAQLGGRRRNLGSDRWIEYVAFFGVSDDGESVLWECVLRDDVGVCEPAPSGHVRLTPGASADEAVRAAICHHIDTTPVPPGRPPADPLWALKHALRGGSF
jgi:hypothetical protein